MTFQPSYVGISDDFENGKVLVWERDENGQRIAIRHDPLRYFFIPDEEGSFTSMYGDKLKKLSFNSKDEFDLAKKAFPKKFESDIGILERTLMDCYYGKPVPKLNYGFFDIEAEILRGRGFSRPSNPFAPINAITLYKQWQDKFVCIAVPPPTYKERKFKIDLTQYDYAEENVELILVESEVELLTLFLHHLEDFDFISGWNSEFYDLPYLYKRIELLLGEKALRKLSFNGAAKSRPKTVERFGREELVIQLRGRSHLDYMDMFKKFTFEGRESFTLNAIASEEVNAKKLQHIGLYDLYLNQFEKFVHYNLIDVVLIKMIDVKFKFVQLVNQMAHENTVTFDAILGTTKYVDTGITNFAHHYVGVRVKDKEVVEKHGKVEGAIVMTPNRGLHEWVGSVDINSLYPSVIRSLNLSPEKVLGQFDTEATQERFINLPEVKDILKTAEIKGGDVSNFVRAGARELDWKGIKAGDSFEHTCWFGDGTSHTMTGKDWKVFLKEAKAALSAYGTLMDHSSGSGIMPQTLAFWYSERKRLQAEKKKWTKTVKELEKAGASAKEIEHAKVQEEYFDLLQLTKKISLNSAYGALLNMGFRWGAENIGASVTYTGRAITSHMLGTIGYLLTGEFVELQKSHAVDPKGNIQNIYEASHPCIIYGDTDSGYFATGGSDVDEAVEIADTVAEAVNDSFPEFMREAFNCQPEFDDLIKAGREVVAERGLFQARKKYMLKVVDLEGFRVNKFKAMGSEIKKSDTPKVIQKFMKATVDKILDGEDYASLEAFVNVERGRLFNKDIDIEDLLLFGTTKAANNIDLFSQAYNAELAGDPMPAANGKGKLTIPGHVRAAINYNVLVQEFEGNDGSFIMGGDKVKVFNLKSNDFGFDTIAIPAESEDFPFWFFDNFKINLKETENKLIDSKLAGIFEAWGYEVPTPFSSRVNSIMEW